MLRSVRVNRLPPFSVWAVVVTKQGGRLHRPETAVKTTEVFYHTAFPTNNRASGAARR